VYSSVDYTSCLTVECCSHGLCGLLQVTDAGETGTSASAADVAVDDRDVSPSSPQCDDKMQVSSQHTGQSVTLLYLLILAY